RHHGEAEEPEIHPVAVDAGIVLHVCDGIKVYRHRDKRNQKQHQCGLIVEKQSHVERPGPNDKPFPLDMKRRYTPYLGKYVCSRYEASCNGANGNPAVGSLSTR